MRMWSALILHFVLVSHAVTAQANNSSGATEELLEEALSSEVTEYIVQIRRHLHAWPELSMQEHNTSTFIQGKLRELGIPFKTVAGTGISALLGSESGPQFALRADMDALPIEESTDITAVERSKVRGAMHACGHDAHVAMLLGAAKLLKHRQHEWGAEGSGGITLVFQPGEEGKGGAKHVIAEGGLHGATAIGGIHVWPGAPSGTITTRAGVLMAASDRFNFTVDGKGGHGAMPHLAHDPVVAASAIVMALQPLVSRETSPTDGAVVTVSCLNTGPGASNVIPDQVEVQGTLRALSPETFDRLHARLEQVVSQTAATYGCSTSTVQWSPTPYPPLMNDPKMVKMALSVGDKLVDSHRSCLKRGACQGSGTLVGPAVELDQPSLAAEDFAFYSQKMPSVFTFLGIGDATRGTDVSLHNNRFQMDERQLALGAALHASTALEYLQRHSLQHGKAGSSSDEL